MYEIYTDGSCRSKTKTGGYGYIVVKDNKIIERFVKKELDTTNQRMEMKALLAAYQYFEENDIKEGTILSDSSYCLNCKFDKWYMKWEDNGFISSKGNQVLNRDLWEQIIPYFKKSPIKLKKVPGHQDCYYNNFIDSLVTSISSSRLQDLTGQKFGKLQVVSLWGNAFTEKINTTFWKCICDCGEETIVSSGNLRNNLTKSCGRCLKITHYENLKGKRFGFLEPLEYVGKDKNNYALWKCKCHNCNNEIIVSSRLLKAKQISCGCIKSKGETKIISILKENNINFSKEYKFKDLSDKDYLKFDFAIFDDNNKLKCLIEYQGIQHFKTSTGWSNEEHLLLTQKHDEIKRKYCKENNIKLIEIPYTDYNKINEEYIKRAIE